MEKIDYNGKDSASFLHFIETVVSRELEYYIIDSIFTKDFNYRLHQIVRDIKKGKPDIECSIIFGSDGEASVVDSNIIGKYICDLYNVNICEHYKVDKIEKIINEIDIEKDEVKTDFVLTSINIFYDVLEQVYKKIIYNKDIYDKYREYYYLVDDNIRKNSVIVPVLLIMEDICKNLKIKNSILINCCKKSCDTTM
ncbi:hypothetical protein [Clostridium hydrogenum]|uniref:hypothetical protein n=1 Tax=Clostridium hydrogenum TaxID=2855764 RepID=UPI001F450904|nr:hypothetical protein [Clostridium hydrogenum]